MKFGVRENGQITINPFFSNPRRHTDVILLIVFRYVLSHILLGLARGLSLTSERAFSYSGPQAWNDLPLPLREAASLPAFNKQLKRFCLTLHSANYSLVFNFSHFGFYFTTSFMLVMRRRPVFILIVVV